MEGVSILLEEYYGKGLHGNLIQVERRRPKSPHSGNL